MGGDGASTEQEDNVFRSQSTSCDGEGLRRFSIKPLCIVNNAQHGLFGRQLGQEAKQRESHEQAVGRRAGHIAERHTKSFSMRHRQLFKGGNGRCAELLGSGKRELFLGFVPDNAEHLKPSRRVHGVIQQGGLADTGLSAHDHRSAVPGARRNKDPIKYLALVASPE
jgi:hypothetical protein